MGENREHARFTERAAIVCVAWARVMLMKYLKKPSSVLSGDTEFESFCKVLLQVDPGMDYMEVYKD